MQNIFQMFLNFLAPLHNTWIWPGLSEIGNFLGTHFISGMMPSFFIAGAMSVFLDKERITKLMGPKANPLLAYPVSALSGGILTVCSCGVLPIFAGILQQGAGIGPAFTFLMASPAVNLIALSYTYSLMGSKFLIWRAILVFFSAMGIGLGMKFLCKAPTRKEFPAMVVVEEESDRTDGQLFAFFGMLVLIMVSSTGVLDPIITIILSGINQPESLYIARGCVVLIEILCVGIMAKRWFYKQEISLWLKKSYSLFMMIIPKVIAGIFFCGIISKLLPLTNYMGWFEHNNLSGNLISSLIGSLMYFGSIVGVTIVSTLNNMGMNGGPAMALLLSAPAVSLPSVLALIPIAGVKKSIVFLTLVVFFSTLSGYVFGLIY